MSTLIEKIFHSKQRLVALSALFSVVFALHSGFATAQIRKNEISTSAGVSVYQSVYSTQFNRQFELAYSRLLSENLKVSAGFRYYFKPAFPAGYARLSLFNRFGAWEPSVGIETGFSDPKFTYSDRLLQETKAAMNRDLGHNYLSTHIAPLGFAVGKKWHLSALEINLGSHVKHIGRTVFVQVSFLNLAYTF